MRWAPRSFPVKIHRHLNVADLAYISPEELEQAEAEGTLAGNRSYCDLRGCGWGVVRTALDIETKLIDRLKMADDVEAEMSAFEEERATAFDDEARTLGAGCRRRLRDNRDFGLRLSPCVQSCNAGAFGGCHSARYPYVAFFFQRSWRLKSCVAPRPPTLGCSAMKADSRKFMAKEKWISSVSRKLPGKEARLAKKRPDDECI